MNREVNGMMVVDGLLRGHGMVAADEVWVHGMWTLDKWVKCIKAKLTGKKLVRMTHGSLSPVYLKRQGRWKKLLVKPIERLLFAISDRVVATGPWEVDWARAWGIKREIEVIELKQFFTFNSAECRRKLHELSIRPMGTPLKVLYLGRVHPLKGVDALMAAVREINGFAETHRLGELVELKLVHDHFGEELECDWKWAEVLCLPTLSENFALVVAEALSRGIPVITTDGAPAWSNEEAVVYLKGYARADFASRVQMLKRALAAMINCPELKAWDARQRRVWIINPYDNLPLEGYRPQRFWLMARAFGAAGCETTLWTSAFSHANKKPRVLNGVGGDGFDVEMVKTTGYRANIGLGRIIDHQMLARNWRKKAVEFAPPDLIIVSSPPLRLVAEVRRFAQQRGIPYIIDVMDAWPETFERVVPRWVLALVGLYRMARENYLGAAQISVVARRYVELVRTYGYRGVVKEFLHGIDQTRGCESIVSSDVHEELRLVYAGNMSLSYDLETVINAVVSMDKVTLDLAGEGPNRKRLESMVANFGAEAQRKIRFHGYLSSEELLKLLGKCDVGVVPMFSESCVGVPYKLADYAAAGLPILNSLEGEAAELLREYGAGVSYHAGDVQGFCRAVTMIKSADRTAMSQGSHRLAELFEAKRIYADYVDWATKLLNDSRSY